MRSRRRKITLPENIYEGHWFRYGQDKRSFHLQLLRPPRWSMDEFQYMLKMLVSHVRLNTPVIIVGDFNARATE